MTLKIGIDGGGSKTECILIDADGGIVARHLAPGCNPNIVGRGAARQVVTDAIIALTFTLNSQPSTLSSPLSPFSSDQLISTTLLCMSGSRTFWQDFAVGFKDFGRVLAVDDSHPILELATNGRPGLVLHAGTGSFVAARAPDGSVHYAGGLGWRFGDAGSGYDLGRRAIARALLELQGWSPPSPLGPMVCRHAATGGKADANSITRFFYQHPDPNPAIAALAPAILELAGDGDPTALQIVNDSVTGLLALATRVAAKLFPDFTSATVAAGLSGPILNHPVVGSMLVTRPPLSFTRVEGTPIEGVRRLLTRL